MGFFDKVKENITHGGVDISVQLDSINASDGRVPIVIHINAGDESRNITSVKAVLKATRKTYAMEDGSSDQPVTTKAVLATAAYSEPFQINPQETKSLQMELSIMGGPLDPDNFNYTIEASANVEGIVIDPSTSKFVTVSTTGF